MTAAQRVAARNGIWLCRVCHKLVDADESPFSVSELQRWKSEAEGRARTALEAGKQRDRMPLLVAALHRSMEMIPDGSLARSLPLLLRGDGNREVAVDVRDAFATGTVPDARAIVERQVRARDALWQLISDYPGAELAYYGIAHIPLAFHFGFLMGTRSSAHFAERDRDRNHWHWIDERATKSPPLGLHASRRKHTDAADVVLTVSVSYGVATGQIPPSMSNWPVYSLAVDQPQLDLIRCKPQLDAYSSEFRSALEVISRRTAAKRIHVLAATPMSLSFSLGRQIRTTVHPHVYVYHYRRDATPAYAWGMLMTDAPDRATIRQP